TNWSTRRAELKDSQSALWLACSSGTRAAAIEVPRHGAASSGASFHARHGWRSSASGSRRRCWPNDTASPPALVAGWGEFENRSEDCGEFPSWRWYAFFVESSVRRRAERSCSCDPAEDAGPARER